MGGLIRGVKNKLRNTWVYFREGILYTGGRISGVLRYLYVEQEETNLCEVVKQVIKGNAQSIQNRASELYSSVRLSEMLKKIYECLFQTKYFRKLNITSSC